VFRLCFSCRQTTVCASRPPSNNALQSAARPSVKATVSEGCQRPIKATFTGSAAISPSLQTVHTPPRLSGAPSVKVTFSEGDLQ